MPTAKPPKNGKLLYHLTDIRNLGDILKNGLKPRSELKNFVDIADKEIIDHRKDNNLQKYVPFHFFAPTPFAGSVQRKNQKENFLYITISRKTAEKENFKILPKHPLSCKDSDLLDYKKGIDEIDWDLMSKREYSDTKCKITCMAECLTDKVVTYDMFAPIFVKKDEDITKVNDLFKKVIGGKKPFSTLKNEHMFAK